MSRDMGTSMYQYTQSVMFKSLVSTNISSLWGVKVLNLVVVWSATSVKICF